MFPAAARIISSALWGDGSSDTALPAAVQSLFTTGTPVTVAATDIRPEDAAFAACRVNSALGVGSNGGGGSSDGLDGLGYNSNNAAGVCPASGLRLRTIWEARSRAAIQRAPRQPTFSRSTSLEKTPSAARRFPLSASSKWELLRSFLSPSVIKDNSATCTNASQAQLQEAFSGAKCDASAFGLPAGGIGIFLREPLSGTTNTTEATVFRHPEVYPGAILGTSQEANVGANNPLAGQSSACLAGGGGRYRESGLVKK